MKDFIYQTSKDDCGFTSLKMMLASLAKNPDYLYLPYPKDKGPYSLLELKEEAKKHGLLLAGYLVNQQNELLHLRCPFILVTNLANGNKHAVLVKKINNYYAYIYDPNLGKRVVLTKKLMNEINVGVEVLVVENYLNQTLQLEINPLINRKDMAKVIGLELLAVFSYFFSAYFIDHESHFLYPVILTVIGALFAIAYKITSFNVLKRFDETYIRYTYDPNKIIRERNYRLMHETKSGLLSNASNIILTLSSVLMINVILILQSTYSVFVILTSGILVLLDVLLFSTRHKKRLMTLEEEEKEILSKDKLTKEEYFNQYDAVKEKTYHIARLVSLKRMLIYFILLMVTIFMSGVTENANLYFVLFYFAMSIFTYTSLDNAITMVDHNKENIINQTKFYNLISRKKNDKSLQENTD